MGEKIVVTGNGPLKGCVEVSGSKNAALPILAATILAGEGKSVIRNCPDLADVKLMLQILGDLGIAAERRPDGSIEARVVGEENSCARYEFVSQMRASIAVLGPLLAKRGYAKVSMPGGCVIGLRPIDLHLKGLRALGAEITYDHGYVVARAKRLRGAHIYLGGSFGSTVLGTANVMMAACLAEGKTVIECAACEPEVTDLAQFLCRMGATIEGIGTPRLAITGVPRLHGARHEVIPDRIEASTFLIAGAITRGEVCVRNALPDHLAAVTDKLREIGCGIEESDGEVCVYPPDGPFKAVEVTTLPYPGYPTDCQAQLMALLSVTKGISVLTEKIYPDRFMHLAELNRMGADIRKEGATAIVVGTERLSGAPVMASDLRASAALILAGLVADGETEVLRVYHIDRGYERIEEKLKKLGANCRREKE